MSLGGKVRPRLCPHREAHTHTNALDTAGVPNIVGAVSGGVGVGTSAAALGVGTRTDASPGTSTPVPTPGMAAVDGTPSVFLSRTCGDDEDLLLDTPLDYSETMCLRHVASGGALFDYDMRHGTKRANRLATPPSPTKAAAAARNSPAAAMAALPAANPSLPWTARFPHRSFPGCVLEPSCLFEDSPSDNMPDTPLNQPGENLPTLPEPEGRGSGNLAAAAAAAGGGAASGPGNAAVGVGQIQGQAEAAVREAEAMSVNAMSPYGFLGGVGAAGGINAIRANSSITSVGSPLSDVYVENGESGVRVGGTGGATSSHAGTMAAAAASAAAITAAAVGVAPSGGGGLADSEVLTKRESCINPPLPHGAVAMHPMAPFKTAAPLALSLPAAGLQPASPWTPAQGMSISAPPMSLTHTMPTQPASPGHWADQLPPGQASGASVHMPYGFGAGSTMAPPAMPSFTASSPLSPAHMPHVLPAQSSHTVTATPTAPQLQRCQQVLMQLGGSHEGASILQSEHGHVQQHPPHSVVMSQSFPLLSTLAPPATSAPPSGPPPQRQQSGTEPSQLQPLQPLLALQTQQPQPHALVPDVYFMSPGCYYLPPGTLLPFGGFFNPLSPYSPASGHPPAAAQMPVPMQRCTPCHYVQGTMSQTEEHQHLQMMQGMVSVSQQQQQQQQRRKEQPQPLPQWTSLQLLQQSMSHQQLQQLPQSMSHQQLLPLQRSASQLPEQQQQLQPQESA
ncbi:hypothetical protein Vretifemale_9865 [Volvox reticuliferus]|nr:hypothetical protein Vretifemale_9865 [Volvox reticuliferus]